MRKKHLNKFILVFLTIFLAAGLSQTSFAQSIDPDAPTALRNGVITGESSGNLYDDKTYYYSFDVKPGTLTLTLDMTPVKGTGGGTLAWHLLNTKFNQLKYDILAASNSPERQVKDLKITVKRKIILKIVVGGKFSYKLKLAGSALNFAQ